MPFLNPDEIIVPPDRYRQDLGDIDALASDIERTGQFIPIMVQRDNTLIYGERRLRACQKLGRKVWAIYPDEGEVTTDTRLQTRRIELMENVARMEMNPVEESDAIRELDTLMKEEFGLKGGHKKEGWSYQDTAELLGLRSKTSVYEAVVVSKAAEVMPELREAPTMQAAKRTVQTALRAEAVKELSSRRAAAMGPEEDPTERLSKSIIQGDCIKVLETLPDGSVSIFLTDPPFAIDIDKVASTPTKEGLGGLYPDEEEDTLETIFKVIHLMKKKGKPNCFVYLFCAVRHYYPLSIWLSQAGFNVYNKLLVWLDAQQEPFLMSRGLCNMPSRWPASNSTCLIFASRGDQPLAQQGQPDILVYPGVKPSDKIHPVELPTDLLVDLISRIHYNGTKGLLVDPFCGSGATLRAALHFDGLDAVGIELNPEWRDRAVAQLINHYERLTRPEVDAAGMSALMSAEEEF